MNLKPLIFTAFLITPMVAIGAEQFRCLDDVDLSGKTMQQKCAEQGLVCVFDEYGCCTQCADLTPIPEPDNPSPPPKCRQGYYCKQVSSTSFAWTKCPGDNSTTSRDNDSLTGTCNLANVTNCPINDCYVPAGREFTDQPGTYKYAVDCTYPE